jgi:hypothetical protein
MAACPRPLAPGQIDGRTVICGTVNVRERHDAPDGRRISLAFGLYKSRSLAPAGDPVIYLRGGPGGGAVAKLATTKWRAWRSPAKRCSFRHSLRRRP